MADMEWFIPFSIQDQDSQLFESPFLREMNIPRAEIATLDKLVSKLPFMQKTVKDLEQA